uniref:ATP synthase complex subunit 8 n=1 Tax=Nepiomorpha sp. NespEL TaxID=1940904 RepID=A0A8K1ZG30_9NEOP|nr:ATP synthase F0 subunit 8 [Nepiomorpha sp. NespEL]
MPQMNPTYWLSLFSMFISVLILTNCIIFFFKQYKSHKPSISNVTSQTTNWKW